MANGINLDPESLAHIVQKAVLDSITPEARDQLLADAIKNLLTIPNDTRPAYDRNGPGPKSPLQESFELAVRSAAAKVVRETIENDPKVAEAIRAVVHPLVADLCDGSYTDLPTLIGDAFGTWLRNRRG